MPPWIEWEGNFLRDVDGSGRGRFLAWSPANPEQDAHARLHEREVRRLRPAHERPVLEREEGWDAGEQEPGPCPATVALWVVPRELQLWDGRDDATDASGCQRNLLGGCHEQDGADAGEREAPLVDPSPSAGTRPEDGEEHRDECRACCHQDLSVERAADCHGRYPEHVEKNEQDPRSARRCDLLAPDHDHERERPDEKHGCPSSGQHVLRCIHSCPFWWRTTSIVEISRRDGRGASTSHMSIVYMR